MKNYDISIIYGEENLNEIIIKVLIKEIKNIFNEDTYYEK